MRLIVTTIFFALATPAYASDAVKRAPRAPGSLTQTLNVGVIYAVDVTVAFDEVQNLTAPNLGPLFGVAVSTSDPLLLARLPALGVSIPADFPVKIDISPPPIPLLGLQFDGVAMITLVTENLPYTPGTRLRLFSADDASSPFVDITEEVSEGSYRVRGSRGEFSEFMIVLDERDPADIVDAKFTRVNDLLTTHMSAIDAGLFPTLSALIAMAQSNWAADDVDAAKAAVQSFDSAIQAATALQIPRTWRSTDDLTNVAGLLRAAAGTLLFSLEDARDTDLDSVYDFEDNCTLVSNPSQCDSDADGFGNHCDADLDNNGMVNSFDLTLMRDAFGASGDKVADLDCNSIVNSFDLQLMREAFGNPPGPGAP